MSKFVFLNNGFLKEENAVLHFSDLAFQRGYGIFDFFRLKENHPLFLEDHLDRFYASAQNMHLAVPLNRQALQTIIKELIGKNNCPNTGVRITLTGGNSADGFTSGAPNLLISQQPFSPPSKTLQETGISLLSHCFQRQLPQVKTIDYLMAVWLQPLRIENGADDILYHNNGFITECPRSNLFLVTQDNRIVTPDENVLHGITRRKIIELAKEDYIVEERPIHLDEVWTAKEAFITSTTKQILPVAKIDDKMLPEREISRKLLECFQKAFG